MKVLDLERKENIIAGDAIGVIDGVCAAVGVAGLLRFAVPGLNYLAAGCTVYGIARGAGWIE
jgi:hypothetical protein